VVGTGLLENFTKNRTQLTYFALVGVLLMLLVWHRSIVRAVLSLVPVLIAVGLSSMIAWLVGVDLSPLTAVGGPLVIALGSEFTTLLVLRHLEERRRGLTPKEAVDQTAARTGRAFVVSALAAVIGVAVLAFSSLPLLRDFGLLVALNVAIALLSALVVLPPLLIWADERGWVHQPRQDDPGPAVDRTGPGLRQHGDMWDAQETRSKAGASRPRPMAGGNRDETSAV
jgi:predicted RND superfamily exporter protein